MDLYIYIYVWSYIYVYIYLFNLHKGKVGATGRGPEATEHGSVTFLSPYLIFTKQWSGEHFIILGRASAAAACVEKKLSASRRNGSGALGRCAAIDLVKAGSWAGFDWRVKAGREKRRK